jgi:hypothetical protein
MLEELRLRALSHFYSAKLHVGNDKMHFTSGIIQGVSKKRLVFEIQISHIVLNLQLLLIN